ncbi:tail assembly protein [Pantoea sp. Acro-805]|uniref:Tail assembly protein n=2 Tax=Candidatus Pantoea formicae TaxID=2608355 RepID=A0ABX0QYN4_9GAMM|nr:tail assembly protein [Pantoea formicae]
MTEIRLYGVLGQTFGKTHRRMVSSAREAIRALCITIPGFEKFLNNSRKRGLTYSVFIGGKNVNKDDFEYPHIGKEIKIAPVIVGSKRAGALQTILGAVLVVVGVVVGVMSSGTLSTVGFGVAKFGAALMVGGIVQMLSPQPTGLASKQSADNQASYAFGSPTNTASQGYPVPLCYGQRRIGGAIISAGIYVEDQM